MPNIRIGISGLGDTRDKLRRLVGATRADETVGQALKAGAEVFGREIERTYRNRFHVGPPRKKTRANWKRTADAIKSALPGRPRKEGPVYFSAVNRKQGQGTPQARWLHTGTKRQKARPWVFNDAIARARTPARQAVRSMLARIRWENA